MGERIEIEAADRLLEDGRLAEAEALYNALLEEDLAKWAQRATFGLARCARGRGKHIEAARLFQCVAEMVPDDAARWNSVAEDLCAAGLYAEAEKIHLDVLSKLPGNASALGGVGDCRRYLGDRETALDYFRRAAEQAPDNLRWLMDMAGELQALGRVGEQAETYQRLLALKPDNQEVQRRLLGLVRAREGRVGAEAFCRDVLTADSTAAWARLELADELLAQERHAEAEAEFSCLLSGGHAGPRVLLGLGLCVRQRGDQAAMRQYFTQAAEQSPRDFSPHTELALAFRNAGEFEAARDVVRRFLAHSGGQTPEQACQAEISLALTERAAGQHQACLAAFRRAHELSPNHIGIMVEMAGTEKHLGLLNDCITHLRAALCIDAANADAVRVMGEMLQAVGDIDGAYALYRTAVGVKPADITLQLGYAEVLNASGQPAEAAAVLASLEERQGMLSQVRCKRIELARERGFYAQAVRLAREATAAQPDKFELWCARFACEILYAGNPGVEESILGMRPATQPELARKRLSQGRAMESAMLLDEAWFYYEAAAALAPQDREIRNSMTRLAMLRFDLEGATEHLRQSIRLEASSRLLQGKSQNISQSFFGQLLDEYRMDDEAASLLRSIRALPAAERAAASLQLVPDYPDNTAIAAMLLVAMRQADLMRFQPRAGAGAITRRIHQFWDTAPPEEILELMRSWHTHNPGWQVTCFDQKTAAAYIQCHYPAPVLSAFLRATEPAMKADIFRLAVLAQEGGIYADADDRCQSSLAPLLPAGADLVLYQEDIGTIGNNFIAAAPGHPLILAALHAGVEACNRGDADLLWLATGPGLISRIFAQHIAGAGRCANLPPGMVLLHRNEILPAVAMHCFVGYKKTSTHWTEGNFAKLGKFVVEPDAALGRPAPPSG